MIREQSSSTTIEGQASTHRYKTHTTLKLSTATEMENKDTLGSETKKETREKKLKLIFMFE